MLFSSRRSFVRGIIGGAILSAAGTAIVAVACQDRNVAIPMFIETAIILLGGAIAVSDPQRNQEPVPPKNGGPNGPVLGG